MWDNAFDVNDKILLVVSGFSGTICDGPPELQYLNSSLLVEFGNFLYLFPI